MRGIETQPRWGSGFIQCEGPNVATRRQRWAGGRDPFGVKTGRCRRSGRMLVAVLNVHEDWHVHGAARIDG
jgi:hypothetical protein